MIPFVRPRPVDNPTIRLVVFHHAGGSASAYFPLVQALPADWDLLLLDLPGRGKRHRSAPLEDMRSMVDLASADILDWSGCPIALFGHSLGAVLAAEVARCLQSRGVSLVWVGVSGRVAPGQHIPAAGLLHRLPDAELMRQLIAMGGMPDRLNELPVSYRARLLDLVRSDLRAVDSYRPDPARAPLSAPLTVFLGSDDAWTPASAAAGWAQETNAGFRQRHFSGGHFHFLGSAFGDFAGAIMHEISTSVTRDPLFG